MIRFAALTPSLAQPGGAERTILIQLRYSDLSRVTCSGVAVAGHAGLDENLGCDMLRYTTLHGDTQWGRWPKSKWPKVDTHYESLIDAVKYVCSTAHALIAWGSLSLARFTAGVPIPVICVSHCSEPWHQEINGVTHLVGVSQAACKFFTAAPNADQFPVRVIPNGIEVDRACPRKGRVWQREQWGVGADDKVLLYLGRQATVKNPHAAVRALAKLPGNYKLILIGNQAHKPEEPMPDLVELVRELGVEGRVKFLPPIPFVGDALAGADCMVHLSRREADSLTVKESFFAGLPLVHTSVGAIPEMEEELGPIGWKVNFQPADGDDTDADEAAEQIQRAADGRSNPILTKMQAAAWKHWTATAMCERWANYLEEVAAGWDYPEDVKTRIAQCGTIQSRFAAPELALDPLSPHPKDYEPYVFPIVDPAKPRTLPKEIIFPTDASLKAYYIEWAYNALVGFVVKLARGIADDVWRLDGEKPKGRNSLRAFPPIRVDPSVKTVVRESEDLKPIDWSSFPCLVDGVEVVVDYGDWNIIRAGAADHKHWLRMHFHSSYKAYPWAGSFPPATFMDWAYYDRIQRQVRERRNPMTASVIMNNQYTHGFKDSRARRRFMVQGMLAHYFGDRMDFEFTDAQTWHAKAVNALCYIQVPGSWENILDRGQLQMMGLGIPTISPYMIDQCCDGLLQPNVHYLMCRQDYMDIPELVNWCERNREEAAAIGHNAWLFFQEFCTPLAVWSYVKDRIDNGPRHMRDTIDNDLCPPGLYSPEGAKALLE
jgi:glycosyltransferase involved in cell wall biosynthesis